MYDIRCDYTSRYIQQLIQADNAKFGTKQSAAHALLLASQPSVPPHPIALDAQLPHTSAHLGALETQYATGNYVGNSYGSMGGAMLGERELREYEEYTH
jgi:hypothetical protein